MVSDGFTVVERKHSPNAWLCKPCNEWVRPKKENCFRCNLPRPKPKNITLFSDRNKQGGGGKGKASDQSNSSKVPEKILQENKALKHKLQKLEDEQRKAIDQADDSDGEEEDGGDMEVEGTQVQSCPRNPSRKL